MDNHSIFITSVVVIIVIFLLMILGVIMLSKEPFQNLELIKPLSKTQETIIGEDKPFIDTNLPDLKFRHIQPPEGSSLYDITQVLTNRHPIAIEESNNWWNTQPGTPIVLGTNMGAGKCACN